MDQTAPAHREHSRLFSVDWPQLTETCLHPSRCGLLAPAKPTGPSQLLMEPPAPGTMGSNCSASLSI